MVWMYSLLLLLTIFTESRCLYVYHGNECQILTAICKEDRNCPNVELFGRLCAKKYHEYSSSQPELSIDSSRYPSVIPLQTSYENGQESTIPYQSSDSESLNQQYSKRVDQHENPENKKSEFKNIRELLNTYNLYKRHSLRESIQFIKQNLVREFSDKTSDDADSYYGVNGAARERVIDQEIPSDSKAFDIVKKAVALLKTVSSLKSDTPRLSSKRLLGKALTRKEVFVTDDNGGDSNHDNDVVKQQQRTETSQTKKRREEVFVETEQNVRSIPTESSHQGREEVAVPIYSSAKKEERIEETVEKRDSEGNRHLLLKLSDSVDREQAIKLADILQSLLADATVSLQKVDKDLVSLQVISDRQSSDSIAKKLNEDQNFRKEVENESGSRILKASTASNDTTKSPVKPVDKSVFKAHITVFAAVICACTLALIIAAIIVCIVKRRQAKSSFPAFKKNEAIQDYTELCRTQMSVTGTHSDNDDEDETDQNSMRHNWYEDQFPYNMDISTGHVILAYMEDHLRNENRLNKEWEALCNYKADEAETNVGSDAKNTTRNRYGDVLPFDRTRVKLRDVENVYHSDYINANFITDIDPHNPDYIATQGPLDKTVADFWQMIWEQGVVVIVNLTKLSDMGLPQCHRYWPEDGCEKYHIFEVHLISEHIWCDDYLVRSLYLKNLQTRETRTITQFNYLTWPDLSVPDSARPLLEFRRKVNKCYRGQSCPIVVHCNNGVGRTGTYILLDMVLNKMIKGAKEIDIAATLEHLRDQRQDMVKTKGQFEFALTAMAEEVTAILSAVPK